MSLCVFVYSDGNPLDRVLFDAHICFINVPFKEAQCFLNRFSYLYYVAYKEVVYLQVKLDRCLFHKQRGFLAN